MSSRASVPRRGHRGFALLVTLLVLVIGATSVFVSVQRPVEAERATEARIESRALARGRDALIARAAADANRPGSLSCPDLDGNGSAGEGVPPSCTGRLGRFPHQTYAIEALRDAAGERIWYTIAEGLLDHGTVTVNPEKVVPFEVNGREGYAAAVLAPGDLRDGQDRRAANRNDPDQYLENLDGTDANNAGPPYRDCGNREDCNDRVRGVTTAEIFEVPQRRVLAAVAKMLQQFHDTHGHLPYAARFGHDECDGATGRTQGSLPFKDDDPTDCGGDVLEPPSSPDKAWIENNSWYEFVIYRVDSDCAGAGAACGAGSLTLNEGEPVQAVIAVAGRPLESPAHDPNYIQNRSGASAIEDYLDSVENTDGDSEFDDVPPNRDDNDSLQGVVVNE